MRDDYSIMADEEVLYETPRSPKMDVKIKSYREINKGFLKGEFILVLNPGQEDETSICEYKHFSKEGKDWFSGPQKEFEKEGKRTFVPYIKHTNLSYQDKIKEQVLKQIKESLNENVSAFNSGAAKVSGKSPDVWF